RLHVPSARSKAIWTASSMASRRVTPNRLIRTAVRRPDSCRKNVRPKPRASHTQPPSLSESHHLPDFDAETRHERDRALSGHPKRLVVGLGLHNREAADQLLGFGEGAIGDARRGQCLAPRLCVASSFGQENGPSKEISSRPSELLKFARH